MASRRALCLLAALLALPPAGSMAQPSIDWSEDDRLATRQGPVILEKAGDANPPRWRITLDGKIIVETEWDPLGLWEIFEGDDDRDHVIVRRASGGIACPYQFRVIETRPGGRLLVSEEFGSCLDPSRTRLYGNAPRPGHAGPHSASRASLGERDPQAPADHGDLHGTRRESDHAPGDPALVRMGSLAEQPRACPARPGSLTTPQPRWEEPDAVSRASRMRPLLRDPRKGPGPGLRPRPRG